MFKPSSGYGVCEESHMKSSSENPRLEGYLETVLRKPKLQFVETVAIHNLLPTKHPDYRIRPSMETKCAPSA